MPAPETLLRVAAVLPLCATLLAGCGSQGYKLAPVSGKITVDEKPIVGLRVSFEPIGGPDRPLPGPDSIAVTDADGKFVLYTTESESRGAVVGPCRVRIWSLPSNEPDKLLNDDRSPGYDPNAEIAAIKNQMRGKKVVNKPSGLIPLRYNDKTELTFEVPASGTDKADFAISSK